MTLPKVLIVEDQRALALALAAAVRQAGAESELAPTAAQARKLLESGTPYEAMVLDIGLPDQNGLDFLRGLDAEHGPPTIVVTAHGEIQNTIAARKLGVVDFLTKPLDFGEFQGTIRKLVKPRRSRAEAGGGEADGGAFIGAAPTMRPVFQQIAHSCASDDPVLVRGETGTGKSHAARLIQANSARRGPSRFLAAGPSTGLDDVTGVLNATTGGGLVIEEVGLLNDEVQAELVRQIEEGADRRFPRLIATTGDDLRGRVGEGAFRSDLFYRLQVLEVHLPPLRERMEDLPALVSYFIGQLAPDRSLDVTEAALTCLAGHGWPGNLRELRNAMAYALTVNTGAGAIEVSDLPPYLVSEPVPIDKGEVPPALVRALDGWLDEQLAGEEPPTYRDLVEALEAGLVRRLLPRYDGKLARLAAALQANRTTLRKRLQAQD